MIRKCYDEVHVLELISLAKNIFFPKISGKILLSYYPFKAKELMRLIYAIEDSVR
jgi:hypothetical protein